MNGGFSPRQGALLAILAFVALFVFWTLLAAWAAMPAFLPTPFKVAHTLWLLLFTKELWIDVGMSVARIALGFVASLIVAVPLGIIAGSSRSARAAIEPLAAVVRYIPPPAFIPILILWFGIGEIEKYVVIFVSVAPYILVMVADAVAAVPEEYLDVARTLGATKAQLYRRIIIPFGLPGIWDSMRVMVGSAWTFIILAEITAAESGIGYRLIQAQRFLKTPEVIAFMAVIGLLGLATDFAFQASYKVFFPWSHKSRR
jgi:NitT/TauT family transport system permease protein